MTNNLLTETKIKNAIAASISESTRPQITVKAPDIYAVTAVIESDDAMAIEFGARWHVNGTTDNGDSFELSIAIIRDYSEYEVRVSNDPSYYGSECSQEDADAIALAICKQTEREFPNLVTELWSEGDGSCSTTGPNEDTCDEINDWVSSNWLAAL